METRIHFFTEDIAFNLSDTTGVRTWIHQSIVSEGNQLGELNYIFCSDDYLHKINMEYLNHDTLTDIITFDNSEEENLIEGDIFISIERVEDNAEDIGVTFHEELARVMIHGVLHLIGYKDKTPEECRKMRSKEDHYLSLRA
jgi:probable rRNA maturation factor